MKRVALLLACVSAPALAQITPGTLPPPKFDSADDNGVDLVTGELNFSIPEGSIGDGQNAVSLVTSWVGTAGWQNNWNGAAFLTTVDGGVGVSVALGEYSDKFKTNGSGGWISVKGNGATLMGSSTFGYTYTARDGTVIQYRARTDDTNLPLSGFECPDQTPGACAIPISITRPDGAVFTIKWDIAEQPLLNPTAGYYRFAGVTGPSGFDFTISYVTNAPGNFSVPQTNWYKRTKTTFTNINNPPAAPLTSTYPTPEARPTTMVDTLGRTWAVSLGPGGVTTIKRPGSSTASTTISYASGTNIVSSITRNGVTTGYSRSISGTTATTVITYADSTQRTVVADTAKGRVTSITDQSSNVTTTAYDAEARPIEITAPEGNKVQYTYDARGNVTATTAKAKTPGTPADIVTTADYPATCTNPLTCNQPTWTKDAKGNQTDYTYNAATGQVATVTAPVATTGAVRPEVRYSYTATNGVSLLTGVSACQTTASCMGTADEVKTTVAYNANLQPSSVSSGAGNGSLTATTAFTYDAYGNRTYVDGPLPGTGDTTRVLYDLARQPVGVIGPDPDAGGPNKNRATRLTYSADGQVTVTETGTTTGQSDSAWSQFAPLQSVVSAYDANARKTSDAVVAGGGAYMVTQYSYDTLGRPDCTAVRMNIAAFGSLPGACAPGTEGSHGPDRIRRTFYDSRGFVQGSTLAVGTPESAWEGYRTYSANGQLVYLVDGSDNYTYHSYDGHDRLYARYMPSKTTPGQLDFNDWEGWSYDANGNVVQQRRRDGQVFINSFDALNRLTVQQTWKPGVGVYDTNSYTYDVLGRLTSETTSWPHTNSFAYDALGRLVSETDQWLGAQSWQYDLAGRLTRTTWNDGTYVDYDRFWTGEVGAIRLNGATGGSGVLAGYSYDDLGRRFWIQRGNSTATSFTYDAISRLVGMGHDAAGTANDVSFAFTYNPAGQIATRTRDNDSYAWTDGANKDVAETPNGLNQLVTQSPSPGVGSLSYDARGNVSGIGGTAYSYDARNLMTQGPAGAMKYDGLGRLFYNQAQSALWRYNGGELTTEQDATYGWVTRRYVRNPDYPDEVLTWFEGSYTNAPRYLLADERGSTIAVTDGGGAVTNKLSYDDYGIPASTNPSGVRFQYTGQAWLPELGMQYSKARIYNPAIGRFMQSDPIGYAGGVNLYAYVRGDPVNQSDPSGLFSGFGTGSGGNGDGSGIDDFSFKFQKPANPPKQCFDRPGSRIQDCYGNADLNKDGKIDKKDAAILRSIIIAIQNGSLTVAGAMSLVKDIYKSSSFSLPFDRIPEGDQDINGCTRSSNVFVRSCNAHDVCYGSGELKSVCDFQFLSNMRAERPDLNWRISELYYRSVRLFGSNFYPRRTDLPPGTCFINGCE